MSDLLSSLRSMLSEHESAAAKAKADKEKLLEKAKKLSEASTATKGPVINYEALSKLSDLRWKNLYLVLIVHDYHCTNCGASYSAPNQHILVEREHPTFGRHYVEASTLEILTERTHHNLSRKITHQHHQTTYCEKCFSSADFHILTAPPLQLDATIIPARTVNFAYSIVGPSRYQTVKEKAHG